MKFIDMRDMDRLFRTIADCGDDVAVVSKNGELISWRQDNARAREAVRQSSGAFELRAKNRDDVLRLLELMMQDVVKTDAGAYSQEAC